MTGTRLIRKLTAAVVTAALLTGCALPGLSGSGAEQTQPSQETGENEEAAGSEQAAGESGTGDIYDTEGTANSDRKGSTPWRDSNLQEVMEEAESPNPRDDFAIYANRDWSLSHEIPDGYDTYDMFTARQIEVDQEIIALLEDVEDGDADKLAQKDPAVEHDLELLRTYHELWLDWDTRNSLGMEPMKELLEPLRKIQTVDELTAFLADPLTVISIEELALCYVSTDLNDADHYAVYIDPAPVLFHDSMYYQYMDYDDWQQEPYYNELGRHLLVKYGYTDEEASQALSNCFSFEKDMSEYIMTTEENNAENAVQLQNNPRDKGELVAEAGAFPILEILTGHGFQNAETFIVSEPEWLRAMGRLYNKGNLQRMKDYLLVTCLLDYVEWLDRDCYEKNNDVLNSISGSTGILDDATAASRAVDKMLPMQLGRVYTDRYVTDEMKQEVTGIVEMIRDEYRGILEEADFLSETSRKEALKKLEGLQLRIAKPDVWEDDSALHITPRAEGGNLIKAQEEVGRNILLDEQKKIGTTVDRRYWSSSPQTVNAYYSPSDNSVTICAGILGGDFYNSDMSMEELLGTVGDTVGHEISHAFDSSGRQFDEKGNFHDWWTPEDAEAFRERAGRLVDYYDAVRPFGGTRYSGTLVEAEAIADLVGFKCVLRVAADQENFDYKKFFETYASTWHNLSTQEIESYLIMQDSHPLAYLRINAVVQQFEEFYETYGVKEGDGMYLAPEDRLEVW